MVSIKACGIYVPFWRLDLQSVDKGWTGERAIANFDEDSLTMGVAAAINCLQGINRKKIDSLFFASSTFPWKEKLASVTAATALDLRIDIGTADFANSLRAGTSAIKAAVDAIRAGSAKQVLVIASDMRLPTPGSDFEREFGDGAAAILLSNEGSATFKDSYSIADEIFDVWRTDEDKYVRSWEERFNFEAGYSKSMQKAIAGILDKNNMTTKEISKAVFYAPSIRRHAEEGRSLGFDINRIQPPTYNLFGDTGAASALMMLASALDSAKPGDKILLASYGTGVDTFLLEVNQPIRCSPDLKQYTASKVILKDYRKYLSWRGLLEVTSGRRRPPMPTPSVTCLWRETDQNIRLHGVKCCHCGTAQYPPQEVCFNCHTRGEFEIYSFADKKGVLATYTEDYATPNPDPPLVLGVVDYQGGGRIWVYVTDKSQADIHIGMPVEMTFRKLFSTEGIDNYFWKCTPIRFDKESMQKESV